MHQILNLSQPTSGFQGVIVRVGVDKALKRKLISLGIRQGQSRNHAQALLIAGKMKIVCDG
jgi:Fe2+ transport system protein FeoA